MPYEQNNEDKEYKDECICHVNKVAHLKLTLVAVCHVDSKRVKINRGVRCYNKGKEYFGGIICHMYMINSTWVAMCVIWTK